MVLVIQQLQYLIMMPLPSSRQNNHNYSNNRTPTRLAAHQQRLRNYKLMYDQLHRSQVHTFVIRKKHLQTNDSRAQSQNLSQQGIESTSHHRKQMEPKSRLPSMQTQQIAISKSQPKSTKPEKIKNIQIIKKMLQINSGNNRISFRERMKNNSELEMQDQPIFSQKLKVNQQVYRDRLNSGLMYEYNSTQSDFKRRVKNNRSSALDKTGKGMKQEKRQRGNNSEMNRHPASTNQIQSITKNKQRNKHGAKGKKALKSLQKQQHRQQKTKQPSLVQSLQSYVKFINAPPDITQLHIHFNFGSIRKMNMAQAWKNLDIKNARMIQALLAGMHSNLQNDIEVETQFLQDCCRLYFNNYEKAKLELILKEHYFKLFAFKLNPIFVYQRIAMYLCYIMCGNRAIDDMWYRDKIKSMVNSLKIIYSLIINIITQTQLTRHSIKSIINASLPRSPIQSTSINETFQLLRSVSQIQKHLAQLQKLINTLIDQNRYNSISEIDRTLKLYLKEQSYGFGNRSYQNFIKAEMLLSWKYLQVPPTPFLPPIKPHYKYTIVLDLDETLIYYNQQTNVLKYRPFLDTFFKKLASLNFQIISFSASSKNYADAMIQQIQRRTRIFQYRLYKEHLSLHQGRLVKDLRRLGRSMSKTIIIDDMSVNFSSCEDNGIEVTSWHGNKSDRQLIQVLTVLSKLEKFDQRSQENKYDDLRKLIKDEKKRLEQILQKTESNEFI